MPSKYIPKKVRGQPVGVNAYGLTYSSNKSIDKPKMIIPQTDTGHTQLIEDIRKILTEIVNGDYHDTHENGLPFPKLTLIKTLESIIFNVKNGKYDN